MRGGPDINLRDRWRRPLIDSLDSLLCASAAALGCFDILQLGSLPAPSLSRNQALSLAHLHTTDNTDFTQAAWPQHGLIHPPNARATETPETAVFDE